MNTDTDMELLFEQETKEIIGCAMEVINELGHGLVEKPYENALVVEFGLRGIACAQQPRFDVLYKSENVGFYIPDLIVQNKVIVDTKVIDRISDHEIGQMMNYLKITRLKVGLIINFKKSRLEWKRVVLEQDQR